MKTIVGLVMGLALAGCGDDSHMMTTPDAASPDGPDHGAPSTTYPAFTPDIAHLVNQGGPTIPNATIVSVTWSVDTHAADYNALSDALGGSMYWHTLNSEYGIGPTTSTTADHVSITTTPPSTMTRTDVQNLIRTNAGTTAGWPALTASTVYVFFIPPGVSFTPGGCTTYLGFYNSVTVGSVTAPYAVTLPCNGSGDAEQTALAALDSLVTNPNFMSQPGYSGFDDDHFAWTLYLPNSFAGYACDTMAAGYFLDSEPGFQFSAIRGWSNQSAHAGHNPCVPTTPGPYFNVTLFPEEQDTITIDESTLGLSVTQTKGIKAQMGQPRTFQVGFYSDARTIAPINISAAAPANIPYTTASGQIVNGTATVSIDKTSGTNGEKAYVTVTPTSFNAMGIVYVEIQSSVSPGGTKNKMPVLIGP